VINITRESHERHKGDHDEQMASAYVDLEPAAPFYPPRNYTNATPADLFRSRFLEVAPPFPPVWRYVRNTNFRQILLYTDGACLSNGRGNGIARGGCGISFASPPPSQHSRGSVSFRLEQYGP